MTKAERELKEGIAGLNENNRVCYLAILRTLLALQENDTESMIAKAESVTKRTAYIFHEHMPSA